MISRRALMMTTGAALVAGAPVRAQSRAGRFEGRQGHDASGTARVIEEDGATFVEFGSDFRFDRAPDPQIALGMNGYDPATLMGKLQSRDGTQRYRVPEGIDASAYNEVWIWCVRFDVPMAVAPLS